MILNKWSLLESADGVKKVENSERETQVIQRRGIWTIKKISKGELFNKSNLKTTNRISASQYELVNPKRNFKEYESIKERDF